MTSPPATCVPFQAGPRSEAPCPMTRRAGDERFPRAVGPARSAHPAYSFASSATRSASSALASGGDSISAHPPYPSTLPTR